MVKRSERKKKHNNKVIKTSFIFAIVIFIFVNIIIINEISINNSNFINNYKDMQQIIVDESAEKCELYIRSILNAKDDQNVSDADVIDNVIKQCYTSGNRYWVFAKNNNVLFKKDDNVSDKIKGMTLDEVFNDDEVISVKKFIVNDDEYTIAMCTNKYYALKNGKVNNHNIHLYIFSGLISSVLLIVIILNSIKIEKHLKKIHELKQEIRDKNIVIENFSSNQENNECDNDKLKKELSSDSSEGIYNRKFLEKMIEKINERNIRNVTVVVFYVKNFLLIRNEKIEMQIINQTARILKKYTKDNHIPCRLKENQIAIIMINCDKGQAQTLAHKVCCDFKNVYGKTSVELIWGAAEKESTGNNMYEVISRAFDELNNTYNPNK